MCQNTLRCIQGGNLLASPICMQVPDHSHTLPRPTTRLKPFLKKKLYFRSWSGLFVLGPLAKYVVFSITANSIFKRLFGTCTKIYTHTRWTVGVWNCHYICFAHKRAKVSYFDDHHHSHDMTSGRMQKCLNLYLAENKKKIGLHSFTALYISLQGYQITPKTLWDICSIRLKCFDFIGGVEWRPMCFYGVVPITSFR